jgi:uncharacterized repeat protein (TIGR01451 family)
MRTRKIGIGTLLTLLLVSVLATASFAVNDLPMFQLDRNATDDGAGDDWATLYGGGGSAADFTGIIEDTTGSNPLGSLGTQFQAGGSKDDLDLSPGGATGQYWKWDPGEPLDKDDITNAYAAAYVNTTDDGDNNVGDLIVYFGLDRYANNGSAQVGFWFLQDPTFGLTTIKDGGGHQFSGHHVVGDVLVQSNFSQGGVIDSISVYEWVGSGGSDGTLDLVFSAQDCLSGLTDDPACATVNQGDTSAPWPFVPKFGTDNIFPQGSFFEGGINITRLVPDAGCFTGFLAETRSSTPFDSRLKDFAFGDFNLCSIEVTKTGDTLSKVGDDVDYTITVENTGAITLYKDEISDSLLGDLTGDAGCGASLAPGATCTINVTRTVQEGDSDPLPNTVTAVYNNKSDLSGSAVSDSDDHSVNLFQPAIDVTKTGDDLSKIGDTVGYTITVYNNSSADTPTMYFDISDPTVGIDEKDVAIANGASYVINVNDFVIPDDATDPFVNTVNVHASFDDFPNEYDDSASWSTNLFQPSIDVTKTGDDLSKIGDTVDYTITVYNNSSADTPAMAFDITDAMVGIDEQDVAIANGGSYVINVNDFEIPADASDPFDNTVNVHATVAGFPNTYDDSAMWSINLFQPSIDVTKTGDDLSKIGDTVDYTITVYNNSSADTPAMAFDITDAMVGIDEKDVAIANGASYVINVNHFEIPADAADPFVNTVNVHATVAGFPNTYDDSASHSINLFQPAITFEKTGDTYSKAGDDAHYTLTLNNTSSGDSPDLKCTITDALLGLNKSVTLASGASDVTNASYAVQEGDDDPLVNSASVSCSPLGFPNVLTASASHSVDLIHPSFTVAKTCDLEPISYLGPANFTVDIANTGDVPLNITADDGIGSFQLAAGESRSFSVSVDGPFTPGGTADNTVTASWTLPEMYGLSNTDSKTATASCAVQQIQYETAYALGDAPTCFTDLGAGNWGWVNGDGFAYILPGDYTWPVWAGAAQCETSNGTLVGTVDVSYDGTDVSVTFNLDPLYILGDTHVYAGLTQTPSGGFSPGQWEIESPFNGEAIYIIVHAVVGIPQ